MEDNDDWMGQAFVSYACSICMIRCGPEGHQECEDKIARGMTKQQILQEIIDKQTPEQRKASKKVGEELKVFRDSLPMRRIVPGSITNE